jgi:hypothetical protein
MKRLFGHVLLYSAYFKYHPARLNDCHPVVNRALTAAHAGFRRLLGDRFIREYPDPHLSATSKVTNYYAASRFYLPCRDPVRLLSLHAEVTEDNSITGLCLATQVAALALTILDSFRL